jgi:hypothetical protein
MLNAAKIVPDLALRPPGSVVLTPLVYPSVSPALLMEHWALGLPYGASW